MKPFSSLYHLENPLVSSCSTQPSSSLTLRRAPWPALSTLSRRWDDDDDDDGDDDDDDDGQPQAHRVRGRRMGWSLRLVRDVDGEINCEDVDVEDQGNHAKDE